MGEKVGQQLKELGSKLETPPTTKDALLKLLKQGATYLSEMDQTTNKKVLELIQPFQSAIIKQEILKHQDREVKLLVATCICEITRITAPEAPYGDDIMKDIFKLLISTFTGLIDTKGPHFGRRVVILETLARYKSFLALIDLECFDLINEMFTTFFSIARDEHSESVFNSMQKIMLSLLEESEDVRENVLTILLSVLGRNKKDVTKASRKLAMNVIKNCSIKLEPAIKQFLISSISGDNKTLKLQIDYHEVIYDIYQCAPQILSGVVPYITGELLTDQLDIRLKSVALVGDLFAKLATKIPEMFQPIFSEFLKRLTDREVEVRMTVLEHVKVFLLSNVSRPETSQIIDALSDRLLDYDENVRKQVVTVICDVAIHDLTSMPAHTIKLVSERLRDKSLIVKKYTMERLAEIYKIYCLNCSKNDEYDWIPGKILRCFYDKDFRSDIVETILCLSLFPIEFSIKDKVKNWIKVFSEFDKVEIKALEKILELKLRLQQEMQRYLSLKQMDQENDVTELHKKVSFSLRVMSRCFTDALKAEENFLILDQIKDSNIWKILNTLLDPSTTTSQAMNSRVDLLKILGEKHRLYEFLTTLTVKCSYLLFNKEHVKEILLEIEVQKTGENTMLILSCMNILVILARFSPLLLSGIEEDLIRLLEDENEIIKEGVLHILAKAGGSIREQLGVQSRSLDLILERMCLEGSRRQAKYAVHALASVTKDDGLMSLSVLYKKLVNMLEEKLHLPAVLQCLGCIAETAMPVFETRESEIEDFIKKNILLQGHVPEDKDKLTWDDRSDICSLKIFGLKTLVKSFMPINDAHLRVGIDDLIKILKNILLYGELSSEIESSSVDKAHLKLAAAKAILRLSKHWDNKITIDVFYLTLQTSEPSFPQVRKLFLNKVYHYMKDKILDPKYACAFLLDLNTPYLNFEEKKNYLCEIIQMCQQNKARQNNTQSDAYPEYITPYLVHALAHNPLFPNIDESKEIKPFEVIYRQLHLFLSMLVHVDEEAKSSKDKESLSVINSIFRNIKVSEDALDPLKSKNSYAICDLGLFVMKRLVPNLNELLDLNVSVTLPLVLYKPDQIKEGDEMIDEKKTWLADEKVLAHFESIELEINRTIGLKNVDDDILKDSDTEANDLPLGKLMKRLKAKAAQARKEVRDEASQVGPKNDVDILKMVREINSDDMKIHSKFESSNNNGHEKNDNNNGKGRVNESIIPKRKRSSSSSLSVQVQVDKPLTKKVFSKSSPKRSFKTVKQNETSSDESNDSDNKSSEEEEEEMSESKEESDLLASRMKKVRNLNLKKQKKNKSDDMDFESPEIESDRKRPKRIRETSSDSRSESLKKQKKSGLSKCTSKSGKSPIMELVGCRIKVWWPMDKQFYTGTVKSFDSQNKKYVVVYDDGDVEVLRLDNERWKLLDNGKKAPVKRSSSSKNPPRSKEILAKPIKKFSSVFKPNKQMTEISPISQSKGTSSQTKGKRTPRKNIFRGEKWKGSTESRNRSIEKKFSFKDSESDSDSDSEMKKSEENSDEEKSSSIDKDVEESKEDEHGSDSESNGSDSSDNKHESEDEISVDEDEPLSVWKERAGKSK